LQASREIPRATGQEREAVFQPLQQCGEWEMDEPRSGQFNGQRETIEALANSRDVRGIQGSQLEVRADRPRALEEEAHRL
jgi:hypothetical protein